MRCGRLLYLPLAAVWSLTVCTTGSPEDQPPPVTVRAREGEYAVLACDLPADPGDRTTSVIEWLHQGLVLPIFIKFGIHPPRIDAAYLGRLSLQEGTALRVERLRSDDGGWYQCRVLFLTQPYDNLNGSWVYLSITTPPTFRRTAPLVVDIRLGEPALLPCEAQGRPEPLVIWSKDGNELPGDSGRNGVVSYKVTNESLKIESVDRSSMGLYTCEAKSEEGSVTHSTQLLVRGPPTIVLPPRNVTVNCSQDAFFPCEAQAYPINLTYSWFKEGVNVHHLSDLRHRVNILTDGSLLLRETMAQDTGLYTCVPSNGLGEPPEASAYLTILHPAYAQRMPEFTFLAAGMRGRIPCPIVAHPPLLYINWTKNGAALELDKLPGWYLEADGTIVITTANDDALGDYSCTPYNSYGTLGESSPTHVILKDPPRFVVRPAERYEQEVGRELSIGCSATGDPQPVVSWSKEGSGSRGGFQVLKEGTLFFRTISKDHHGDWTCEALNNVTQISTTTKVVVLGTSPHAPTNVTVRSDVVGVNVSWEPGFDGGHEQQFTVWVRQTTRGPHDWIIRKVPLGDSQLRVEGLWPGTGYQFSVLAQSDRGSGPFSEIVTTWTLSVPVTTAPPRLPVTDRPRLLPPQGLAANRTVRGILLSWAPPPPPSRPPLGYRLEFRQEGGWGVLHSAIPAGQEQLLLEGLVQDYMYQFRIAALTEDLMSEPSNIVNISTSDMPVYPSGPRVRATLAHPIRAGIIAGCCFLATALVTSVLVSCIMSRRRTRRRRLDVPIIFSRYQKAPHSVRSDSPDSVLKLKFEAPGYETFEAVPRSPRRGSDQKHSQYESHLGCLESIRRGPDGRFMVELQRDPESPRPAAYPLPAHPEASLEFQGARGGVALRSKARGQTRLRPQAHYFSVATSSPAADSQPPCIPDLSPIPPPQSRPGDNPGPGLHGDRPGLDSRPSRSLLNLGCGHPGAGGLSHGLSWPGPLETARPPGPCLRPTQPGPPAAPTASGLPGGLGRREVACSPGLTPQASQARFQALGPPLERSGASGLVPPGSIARPPSLAPSGGTTGSAAPDSSGFHSGDGSQRASRERSHIKRDISGDENYEWDTEFAVESEILEALRLYKRARPSRPNSSIVLQELEQKGSPAMLDLKRTRNVRSLEALCQPQYRSDPRASAASRCAALREEFLEYRRRMEKEERALGKGLIYDEHFEQATLL